MPDSLRVTSAESTKPAPSRRGLWLVVLVLLLLLGISTWDLLQQDSGNAFRRAVFDGDISRVEKMLRDNPLLARLSGNPNPLLRLHAASPKWLQDHWPITKPAGFDEWEAAGASALHIATARTNLSAIKLLLAAGASPDVQLANGVTPMRLAIAHRREDIVMLFIQTGADLKVAHPVANPLATTLDCGERATNVLRVLLMHGADPNMALPNGMTPLHWAAGYSELETIRLLAGAGARLNATNSDGLTPLSYALKRNATNSIPLLLSLGAAP